MTPELQARTDVGRTLVDMAEQHAKVFAERASNHDRDGSYVADNIADLRESGLLNATAPSAFGGMDLESLHDLTVVISRIARGCASTAIAVNMHVGFLLDMARSHRLAVAQGDDQRAKQLSMLLRLVVRRKLLVAHAGTEPGGSALYFPKALARPTDDGYVVNGVKVFATNSAEADLVTTFVRVPDGDWFRIASVLVPRHTAGMTVKDDWDPMGMRGSGSNSIVFEDCLVPADMVHLLGRVGEPSTEGWPGILAVNFPLVATFAGLAEAAYDMAVDTARKKRKQPFGMLLADRSAIRHLLAEMAVDVAVVRATLARTAARLDDVISLSDDALTMELVCDALADFQCTKLAINRAAARVVDNAMSVVGGGSYLAGHPLGRIYRDVRAGGFMQPYSPTDAMDFLGALAVGADPLAEVRTLAPTEMVPSVPSPTI